MTARAAGSAILTVWFATATAADLTLGVPPAPAGLGEAVSTAFVAPFKAATGLDATIQEVAAGTDLTLLGGSALLAGCKDGSLRKLDWAAIGGRDRLLPGVATDCGVGAVVETTVLAWDREKVQGAPGWAEFWDVAKVPGKRGLRRGVRANLEIALMADGVAATDIYATLATDQGVERAFRKLDQLKPYIVWWDAEGDPLRLLASGEVLITSAPATSVLPPRGVATHLIAVQWAGGLQRVRSWAVPAAAADTPNVPNAATRFLLFATDPKVAAKLVETGPWGPTSVGALAGLSAEKLWPVPTAPANLAAGLMVNEQFWQDNEAKLSKRFDTWMAK